MKRRLLLLSTLLALLLSVSVSAQQWTVIELPAKVSDMPQLVQDQFGCTYQELPDKYELTHVRFTGTDFYREDYDNEGQNAIKALVIKAKVLDLSQVKDNEESRQWYADSYYYKDDYPGPARMYYFISYFTKDSLEHFLFPKTMTRINSSFGGGKKLKQVTWPDRVENIWSNMFSNCEGLEEMTIPEGVTVLPDQCFRGCSSLTSVTLPSTLKTVGDQVFRSCNALETFAFPDGVEAIGNDSFLYCKGLKRVVLPQSVTSLGYGTFNRCDNLESVALPDRVKEIGGSMFSCCYKLTSVKLPDSTETIAGDAFSYCSALKSVTVPAGVTSIGTSAFRQTALEEFDMPDAVTTLGEYVFEGCKQLRRVHLSRRLTTIPVRTFSDCQALEEVNIPQRVTRIEHDAFVRCYKMPSPLLPEGLTHLDEYAFWDTRFDHINLPSTLQIIGRECFRYSHLRSIDVPANVVEIKQGAFEYCDSLRHATLPEGLLYLQNEAFRDCPLLEDVALPAGLRVLGEWVFHGNKSKKTFVQPPLVNVVPNHICCACENLTSVTLHNRITRIDGNAFDGCKKLSRIDLPEGLETIGSWAFVNCPLTEINIPSSVRNIEPRAFNGGLYSRVVVPEGVEKIRERAFYSKNLRYVDFPSTVSLLEEWAFQGDGPACDSVIIRNPLPPLTWGEQYRSWHGGTLYVPAQSVEAYKNDGVFKKGFVNILPLTGYDAKNIVVATTVSTDSTYFPIVNNANLTIAHQDWHKDFCSGHLHVGSKVNWPLDHLRYDYRQPWQNYDWENKQASGSLINEGTMTVQSMEVNLEYPVDQWLFFTAPFDMKASDLVCNDPRTPFVLRTFDGAQRASGNHARVWADVDPQATLQAGRGYILQYGSYAYQSGFNSWSRMNADKVFNLKNSSPLHTFALSSQPVTIPLAEYKGTYPHNEGWNMVGNPFMAYFDIEQLESDAPIIVAVRNNFKHFQAVSPLDDDYRLKPLEAFLVQRSTAQTSITFNPAGRQADFVSHRESTNSARHLRRQQLRRQRVVYDATLLHHSEQGDSLMATTRLVVTPRATEGYDRGQDAPLFTMDDDFTSLYTRSGGLRYSLNEQPPTTQSVQLGMHLAEAGAYTISITTHGSEVSGFDSGVLRLLDKETGAVTAITEEASTFTIDEPTTLNSRFLLMLGDGITSVECVEASPQQDDAVYDLQGRKLSNSKMDKWSDGQMPKGLYIKNGKKHIHY